MAAISGFIRLTATSPQTSRALLSTCRPSKRFKGCACLCLCRQRCVQGLGKGRRQADQGMVGEGEMSDGRGSGRSVYVHRGG